MKKKEMPMAESRKDVVYFYSLDEHERMGAKWIKGKVYTWIEKVDEKEIKPIIPQALYKIIGIVLILLALSSGVQYTILITRIGLFLIFMLLLITILMYRIILKSEPMILKSKHSSEHKIINFMKKNNRIPNVEELEKSNRFTLNCGGLDGNCTFEDLMSTLFGSIIASIVGINIAKNITYFYAGETVIFLTIIIIILMIWFASNLSNIVFIILILVSQIFTTTKVTREEDRKLFIELAKRYKNWQEQSSKKN